jgi:RNA polymerase sigma-70 factor (ECF subfamily)
VSGAEPGDGALIARVLAGEAGAFRGLVDRYYVPCGRFARRMLGHAQDAEDVLQETFIRAYRALGAYDDRNTFRAWLYRILVNQCGSLARRRVRHDRAVVQDGELAERQPARSEERDADIRDALQRALDRLEPLLREAFLLHYGEGLEYEEMAMITGASPSALKMRVKRARDAMRPELEEAFDA